tara:strand:- start:4149 stop:5015 length:867 start_codon:yes stop_codon:yes gene_type:complete
MVLLADKDIKTREVLDWKGVHLLHFSGSSCSQKTRIFLNLKGIDWVSHPINLAMGGAQKPWFLGVNPRGLVPVLVHDGNVHIESNDILDYLEQTFPSPSLIPSELSKEIHEGLKEENDLHMELRAISMRFVFTQILGQKNRSELQSYKKNKGTIQGSFDPKKQAEIDFWTNMVEYGITDKQTYDAVLAFRNVYDKYERNLAIKKYLLTDEITLLDIAWFIYTHRLKTAGYPFSTLHPRVYKWYNGLLAKPEFSKEIKTTFSLKVITKLLHGVQKASGNTLTKVANLIT